MDAGLFTAPAIRQCVFGATGGMGPVMDNLVFMKLSADRRSGEDCRWPVLIAGGAQMPLAATACQMRGIVRVGLEDSLFIARGKLAENNARQVTRIRRIVEGPGAQVALPDEARELFGFKGRGRVNFQGVAAAFRG